MWKREQEYDSSEAEERSTHTGDTDDSSSAGPEDEKKLVRHHLKDSMWKLRLRIISYRRVPFSNTSSSLSPQKMYPVEQVLEGVSLGGTVVTEARAKRPRDSCFIALWSVRSHADVGFKGY